VRQVELARDMVSEVFERAFVKGGSVRDPAAYSAWLFMVAKNVMAAHFRRSKREFTHQEEIKSELHLVDQPMQPEEVLLRNERVGTMMRYLRTLTRRDQELVSLKFDSELTNAEIGKITGMTALNVRVSLFRALRRLKAKIETEAVRYDHAA
jgi:RNA polymerase sigma factor (sigma-70 family)